MNETKASTVGGRIIVTAVASIALLAAACGPDREKVDYVNTRIGNISHLLVPTYPTTHLPNSMLRMIPDHNEFTTDRMGGLPLNVPSHRNGSVLMMMPYCGAAEDLTRNTSYRYDQEHSTPARYTVYLDDYGIVTDFVPAAKAAIFSCTFEQPGGRYIQIASSGGEIHGEGNAMWGYDNYRGIKQYFYLEFDSAPEAFAASAADVNSARFAESTQCVKARYGISYIDVEQAERNLREQIGSWDMDAMERDARCMTTRGHHSGPTTGCGIRTTPCIRCRRSSTRRPSSRRSHPTYACTSSRDGCPHSPVSSATPTA